MDQPAQDGALSGRLLHDTYRIERLIGQGGMGAVYEAAHVRVRRRLAVKLLIGLAATDRQAIKRFQREAEVTGELGHPNIVEVIDFNYTSEGWPYLVMELLSGEDLGQLLDRTHPNLLELARVRRIFCEAAEGLSAAHERGIIHRDLKPSNLFLAQRAGHEVVKVVDFGISKVLGAQSAMTGTEVTMGTPAYMSPEQAEGRSAEADARTDVFSMGTILYEMLCGEPAFSGGSIPSILYNVVHGEVRRVTELRPTLSAGWNDVLAQALAKDPEQRFPSMQAFADAVRAVADRALPKAFDADAISDDALGQTLAAPSRIVPATQAALESAAATHSRAVEQQPAVSQPPVPPVAALTTTAIPRRRGPLLFAAMITLLGLGLALSWFVVRREQPASKPTEKPRAATATVIDAGGLAGDQPKTTDARPAFADLLTKRSLTRSRATRRAVRTRPAPTVKLPRAGAGGSTVSRPPERRRKKPPADKKKPADEHGWDVY
ncbi:MAG: protein kinase [Deltaproteobacteria bacterium]|nr:protein kinase [Deltaproteobacteria bacterium]